MKGEDMTVYIVTTDNVPVQDWLLDRMSGWDRTTYREQVRQHGLRDIAVDDWAYCWGEGDDVFDTFEAAEAEKNERIGVYHVLTLHLEDVEEAIRRLVGIEEA